jgi:hypothetical protein
MAYKAIMQASKEEAEKKWEYYDDFEIFESEAAEAKKNGNVFYMQKDWTRSWQPEKFPL